MTWNELIFPNWRGSGTEIDSLETTPRHRNSDVRIRSLLEQQRQVRRFLYVVPEPKLASFLLDCFHKTTAAVFVGLASEFTRSFQEMNVIEARSGLITPIEAAF